MPNRQFRELIIDVVRPEATGVISLRLRDAGNTELPPWRPGAHIEVRLPSGRIRQYSLCGEPSDRRQWMVAVLNEPHGRGGSSELHDTSRPGSVLFAGEPRNRFALGPADSYLFLVGGIGITPILPMVRHVANAGDEWTLHYGGRSRHHMAFADSLSDLFPDEVRLWPSDEDGRMPLAKLIDTAAPGTHVYACGPEPMLEEVAARCRDSGASPVLHLERFGARTEPDEHPANTAFEVELRRSGLRLPVPADRTVLEVVRDTVPTVPFDCQQGYCGTCETRVLAGRPEHRDTYLDDQDRAEGELMMICVSRSLDPVLSIDR
jgi:ferredoxin-NADP reductase